MRIRKLIAVVALAVGALTASAALGVSPAGAHQRPYDSGIETEHNLCHIMRPYGVGTVENHYRYTGTHRQCFVCISGDLYAYEIQYWEGAGWTGPWDTTLITRNSVAC